MFALPHCMMSDVANRIRLKSNTLLKNNAMCGIWAYVLNASEPHFQQTDYSRNQEAANSPSARGPDRVTEVQAGKYHFCFHRLAIHDLSFHGDQPFSFEDEDGVHLTYMCNGEIYNWKEIQKEYGFHMTSSSDCEVIGHLFQFYRYDINKVLEVIRGEFAIVARIEDASGKVTTFAVRDPFGVRPLYYGVSKRGIVFSSTLSGVVKADGGSILGDHLSPGCVLVINENNTEMYSYYKIDNRVSSRSSSNEGITTALINSVKRRLDSDRPIGFLLSGGLDSSLIVAIACKILGMKNVHTFSIGMKGSVDLHYAQKVADYLGTKHTEVTFTEEEGISAIPEVIRVLETYDITTIRASVGQYLLARYIKENTDIRVIINGDGADEVEGGYMYFHYAPSAEAAQQECIRLLNQIHRYDGLRVDRTLASNGLEARLPFLDTEFVECYLSCDPQQRMPGPNRMEKCLLRDAFNELYPDILPKHILYRRKEAFSDGVSSTNNKSWYRILQDWFWSNVSDTEFNSQHDATTKESYFYRKIFDQHFQHHWHVLPAYWMPRWTSASDPSARELSVYAQ